MKEEWMLAEEFPDVDFYFMQIPLSAFANDLEKAIKRNYKEVISAWRGYDIEFYYIRKDSEELSGYIMDLIINNPKFGMSINSKIRLYADRLRTLTEEIDLAGLSKMSNRQLSNLFKKVDKAHTELYHWCWLPNATDMFHDNYTSYLKGILSKKIVKEKINHVLMIMTTSKEKSIIQQEQESLLKIAILKQEGKQYKKKLIEHYKRYFYLKHLWIGKEGVYDLDYYRKGLENIEDPKAFLEKENHALKEALKEKNRLVKELKLSKHDIKMFDVYAEFAVTKLYRRDVQIFLAYKMNFVFDEVCKRLKITKMQARFMLPKEMQNALEKGLSRKMFEKLKEREKLCVLVNSKDKEFVLTGEDARKLIKSIKVMHDKGVDSLEGQPACIGYAKGHAKIINTVADMQKMKKGDILISFATNPDIVPAMRKASAIVTDQGGVTSHAAIVSREWGTPCVIGTKIATKVFKDNDFLEVDANSGIVRKIRH